MRCPCLSRMVLRVLRWPVAGSTWTTLLRQVPLRQTRRGHKHFICHNLLSTVCIVRLWCSSPRHPCPAMRAISASRRRRPRTLIPLGVKAYTQRGKWVEVVAYRIMRPCSLSRWAARQMETLNSVATNPVSCHLRYHNPVLPTESPRESPVPLVPARSLARNQGKLISIPNSGGF
jgi:hypothetical protein